MTCLWYLSCTTSALALPDRAMSAYGHLRSVPLGWTGAGTSNDMPLVGWDSCTRWSLESFVIYPFWTHQVSCRHQKRVISLPQTFRLISRTILWPVLWILNSQWHHFRIRVNFCWPYLEIPAGDMDLGLSLRCCRPLRDVSKNTKSVLSEVLGPLIRLGARRDHRIYVPKSHSYLLTQGFGAENKLFSVISYF